MIYGLFPDLNNDIILISFSLLFSQDNCKLMEQGSKLFTYAKLDGRVCTVILLALSTFWTWHWDCKWWARFGAKRGRSSLLVNQASKYALTVRWNLIFPQSYTSFLWETMVNQKMWDKMKAKQRIETAGGGKKWIKMSSSQIDACTVVQMAQEPVWLDSLHGRGP